MLEERYPINQEHAQVIAWALAHCESSTPALLSCTQKNYDDDSNGDGNEDDGAGDDDDDKKFQKLLWSQIPVLTISLGRWQPHLYRMTR